MNQRKLTSAWLLTGVTLLASCGLRGGDASCDDLSAEGAGPPQAIADDFDGTGSLVGYITNNADVLPSVGQVDGRYRAELLENEDDKTLHFFSSQGRIDARLVAFPFDYIARNIGIGTVADSQLAPNDVPTDAYIFAGIQVHDIELDRPNSSHVVVGHRGGTQFTIEGKNTCGGVSVVSDLGPGSAPLGRADLRIVGNDDRTLTIYYQPPRSTPNEADSWVLYGGSGELPGRAPEYGESVYIGLITYAQGQVGLPFVGTADAIEVGPGSG